MVTSLTRQPMGEMVLPSLLGAYQVGVMALPYIGGSRPTSEERRYIDYTSLEPWDRVRLAEELARAHSMDPPMREMGAYILDNCREIHRKGALKLAEWIRWRIRYFMESPGIEILQGPYDTLATRVGDCDDAAILFATLAKAVGLHVRFCGVGQLSDPTTLIHAIGYDERSGIYYELIDDGKYGGRSNPPLVWTIPDGMFTLYWSPETEQYYADWGEGPHQQEEKNVIKMMGKASPSAGSAGPGPSGGSDWYDSEALIEFIRAAGGAAEAALGPDREVTIVTGGPSYSSDGYDGGHERGSQEYGYSEDQTGESWIATNPMLAVGGLAAAGLLAWWAFKG